MYQTFTITKFTDRILAIKSLHSCDELRLTYLMARDIVNSVESGKQYNLVDEDGYGTNEGIRTIELSSWKAEGFYKKLNGKGIEIKVEVHRDQGEIAIADAIELRLKEFKETENWFNNLDKYNQTMAIRYLDARSNGCAIG